ncbi:MAG TPA: thiamine pyrophosphate-dependent enzyme, partial [candidate division Zixibacteria bacterium]|nr:thiamine pyrophosphate-dependent enzyme [candidate division Zixibacteria bacterium]
MVPKLILTDEESLSDLHPLFDWQAVARLALTSRKIDELQESELAPAGLVTYQFSAKGHELGQVLISQLLDKPFDAVSGYYRSRPLMLGVGLAPEEAFASDMARSGGVSAGRDVGVVFNRPGRGSPTVIPMGGDVGSQYTPAAGWAQAIIYRQQVLNDSSAVGSIAVVCGGDGSVATNGFWSCLTMATTLRLPLLIVIEDNGYGLSVPGKLQTPGGDIAANLASFCNLVIRSGSGSDPAEAADLIAASVADVRNGDGPVLLRLEVPRLSGHSGHDNQAYKSAETIAEEKSRDPIVALKEYLVPALLDDAAWNGMVREVEESVREAANTASHMEHPDPAGVTRFLFSDPEYPQSAGGVIAEGIHLPPGDPVARTDDPRRINMVDGIRQTLASELALNPRLLVFGEDVGDKGGVHTATMGLKADYGETRVFDTSLSEEGIIGRAIGMALAGLMPVPEIQFRKYADPAMEQLNNCGTIRWRTANRFAAPIVVRIPGGFGRKIGDPWHSVTGEVLFAHAVGWQVAFPSNCEDAVGLLRSALRGNDPVIFFEHRALLDAAWSRRPYPGDDFVVPFGEASLLRRGDELTVVT